MDNRQTSNKPTVDIIIPVYNVELYLRRCLDSISSQTYQSWRAICVDDGSTDNSYSILEAYAATDSRFTIIKKTNGGLSDARNCGMAASEADYLMFVDSDDFIHPQTLEIAVGLALRDGSDIVSWYRDAVYRNLQLKACKMFHLNPITMRPWGMNRRYDTLSIKGFVTNNLIAHCNDWQKSSRKNCVKHCFAWRHLLRREAVMDVQFTKGLYYEDIPWWSELILKPLKATITDLPLYYYYYNPASISRRTNVVRKSEHIFKGLIKTYRLYQSRASHEQMDLWSHNIKWSILYGLSTKLPLMMAQTDSEHIRDVISELCETGVVNDAQTETEKVACQRFRAAWKQIVQDKYHPRVIVSLTSFPTAIAYVSKAVESVLRGSVLPDKVVLYLFKGEFQENKPPQDLLKLAERDSRFEIRYCDMNMRSYLKLVPALSDFPEDIIVTIDDDINYHRNMLRDLLKLHSEVPEAIIAHRVRKIKLSTPYKKWRKYKWYDFIFKRHIFSHRALLTGVGGVLYPPHSLDEKMLGPEVFTTMAPTTDDIWFWAAAVSKGTYVVPVPAGHNALKEVGKPIELSLKNVNLKPDNDRNRDALEKILFQYPAIRKILENEK